jgi:iron complex transport system ATP-binding protein
MHDLNLAARFADRVAVLSRGRLVEDGPPARVLSEELLRRVWGVVAELRRDPRSGLPYLVPSLPPSLAPVAPAAPGTRPAGTVHVVGGGGSATALLRALADAGYVVTTGALHLLDSDTETAQELAIPAAVEVPFAPLGEEVRTRHRALLAAARVVVLAPFAVGPANLANLEDVLPFVAGRPVYLVGSDAPRPRDFTGGRATELWEDLVARGARPVADVRALLERLAEPETASAVASATAPAAA